GPMAHPVRPDSYIEISNFYTVTIYEKGAEVVRMLKTLAGEAGFRKGTDLYFDRHDGQAVTTDDFVKAIEDANALDLSQFRRWYSQAGTPQLMAESHYDASVQIFTVTLSQSTPATPGQNEKLPVLMPVAMGLVDNQGNSLPLQLADENAPVSDDTRVLILSDAQQTFTFTNITEQPYLSLLRGFSAPVKLNQPRDNAELAFMMAHDADSFNRWDAGQTLFINVMLDMIAEYQTGQSPQVPVILIEQLSDVLKQAHSDPALTARMLSLPTENYLAAQMQVADVDAIHAIHQQVKQTIAKALKAEFDSLYQALNIKREYRFAAEDMAQRSLKNTCLSFLMATKDPLQIQRCLKQMKQSDNMTDLLAGLRLMVDVEGSERQQALQSFYHQWQHDRQVVDKWLTVQVLSTLPGTLHRVKGLMQHAAFSIKNPNNVRAVIGQFCRNNPSQFHAKDGSGYQFLAEQILVLDKLNPQVAARQLGAFNSWRQYDENRQVLMREALQSIARQPDLSSDVFEIVNKYLVD
ncbi:MAG: DUF3458 domain-containing protein, partial [Methylophaga sp.]|nr:DUF3458 domain-containing protein [Methylophaga sp.]